MSNPHPLRALLLALVITIALAFAALIIAVILSTAGSGGGSIVISTGGISQNFINLLLIALPVIFVILFLILRKGSSR
jgi:ABC-type arginine transport system permease subunit